MKFKEISWNFEKIDFGKTKSHLIEIRGVRVAVLHRGRNAWHSTWVEHFLKDAEIFSDVTSAKMEAERKRGPGNKFYITEMPGLLLSSETFSAVLVDANENKPFQQFTGLKVREVQTKFGNYIEGIFPGISIFEALEVFGDTIDGWSEDLKASHLLLSAEIPNEAKLNFDLSGLQVFVSEPRGSAYFLTWLNEPNTQDFSSLLQISETWENLKEFQSKKKIEFFSQTEWQKAIERRLSQFEQARNQIKTKYLSDWRQMDALEEELEVASSELKNAMDSRMIPASTSVEIAAQRRRVEVAKIRAEDLEKKLTESRSQFLSSQAKFDEASKALFNERLKAREKVKIDLNPH